MIQLRVDDDIEDWMGAGPFQPMVHKDLLCLFSPYYNAALKGNFSEARKRTLKLELNSFGARIFVTWLYTGKFLGHCESVMLPVYVLTDQTDIVALRRGLMDYYLMELDSSWSDMCLVINSIPESSGLWRWFVDKQVHQFEEKRQSNGKRQAELDTVPKTFLYDVMDGLAGKPPQVDQTACPCCRDPCKYHEHKDLAEWGFSK